MESMHVKLVDSDEFTFVDALKSSQDVFNCLLILIMKTLKSMRHANQQRLDGGRDSKS